MVIYDTITMAADDEVAERAFSCDVMVHEALHLPAYKTESVECVRGGEEHDQIDDVREEVASKVTVVRGIAMRGVRRRLLRGKARQLLASSRSYCILQEHSLKRHGDRKRCQMTSRVNWPPQITDNRLVPHYLTPSIRASLT
jgi:hypothetical protein